MYVSKFVPPQRLYLLVHIMETDHVLEQKKLQSFAQWFQWARGRSTLKTRRDQANMSYWCHRHYSCRYCHYSLVLLQVLGESAKQVEGGNMQIQTFPIIPSVFTMCDLLCSFQHTPLLEIAHCFMRVSFLLLFYHLQGLEQCILSIW